MLGESSDEDDAVRHFIADRQPRVLASALTALSTCSDADLAALTHRLAGTLGSYRLDLARAEVEKLHRIALLSPDSARVGAHRAATLSALTALAQTVASEQPGDERTRTST